MSQPLASVTFNVTAKLPAREYMFVGEGLFPTLVAPSPNAHCLETMAVPPPPTEESLKCTVKGTHPESGCVAVSDANGFRNTFIFIESIKGFPDSKPVQTTLKLPDVKKVCTGLGRFDVVISPKSQSIFVNPAGEVKLTFTRGAQPLVVLAVICALALDILQKRMKKQILFKMNEEKSEMLIFVFKFTAFR